MARHKRGYYIIYFHSCNSVRAKFDKIFRSQFNYGLACNVYVKMKWITIHIRLHECNNMCVRSEWRLYNDNVL